MKETKLRYFYLLSVLLLMPAVVLADDQAAVTDAVGAVIDDFHDAAAKGDKERYLAHMTSRAVFMGTDEWERWPKEPEMRDYVDGRFQNGTGWDYRSVERNVQLGDDGDIAWFDEVLYSEANGRFRGTGVVSLQNGQWKIEHYAMSFLVPNEIWPDVIELSKEVAAEKSQPAEQP